MMNRNEFERIMSRITGAWEQRNFADAFSLIETIMRDGTAEMRADALLFSGMIKESNGRLFDARQDWLNAIPYSSAGTFARYCLQENIGASFEKEESVDEARKWYRSALQTCAEGEEFSGEKALAAYLSLHDGQIPEEDKPTASAVAEKSWRVLELPGTPPLNDLPRAISDLTEQFSKLVSEIIEEN